MSKPRSMIFKCDYKVERLEGKRVRIQVKGFDGYGLVKRVQLGLAEVELESETDA